MKFLYSEFAKDEVIVIKDISHLKARRIKVGDRIDVRNMQDNKNFIYEVVEFNKKEAILRLDCVINLQIIEPKFTLALGMIDPSVIEKILPSLNELNLKKLILIYCDYSQRNFKISDTRVRNILINSSEQCGRSNFLDIEVINNIDEFLSKYPKVARIDFEGIPLDNYADEEEILFIGCEGGFSQHERDKISKSYTLNSNLILRANTAIIGVMSKISL